MESKVQREENDEWVIVFRISLSRMRYMDEGKKKLGNQEVIQWRVRKRGILIEDKMKRLKNSNMLRDKTGKRIKSI